MKKLMLIIAFALTMIGCQKTEEPKPEVESKSDTEKVAPVVAPVEAPEAKSDSEKAE